MKKLPFRSQPYQSVQQKSIDCIMIYPRSRGTLRVGDFCKQNRPPKHRIVISATNSDLVKYESMMLGNEDNYYLTYEVENRNDSPAFVDIIIEHNQ